MTTVKGRSEQALSIAARALDNGNIRPVRGVDRESCVMNLAKTLMKTHPKSEHGQLLMRALSPVHAADRSPEVLSVRWLVRRGESPSPEAVAGRIEAVRERDAVSTAKWETVNRIADADAFQAAKTIADRIAETGEAPTWRELIRAVGWPEKERPVCNMIFSRLDYLGWIETGKQARSLRPGKLYYDAIQAEDKLTRKE